MYVYMHAYKSIQMYYIGQLSNLMLQTLYNSQLLQLTEERGGDERGDYIQNHFTVFKATNIYIHIYLLYIYQTNYVSQMHLIYFFIHTTCFYPHSFIYFVNKNTKYMIKFASYILWIRPQNIWLNSLHIFCE